jgi:hypothetical protein
VSRSPLSSDAVARGLVSPREAVARFRATVLGGAGSVSTTLRTISSREPAFTG